MDTYDFTKSTDRKESISVKYNRRAIESICNNPDALPFWVADMDFTAPPSVISALASQVDHGVFGYPLFESIGETFSHWALKRHDWQVDPSSVVQAPGMLASIAILVEMLSKSGDSIILPMPAYQPFVHIIKNLGRKLVPWPFLYDTQSHTFTLDIPLLGHLLETEHAPLLLFCSPHNPTGRVFSRQELEAVAEIAHEHSLTIISDEIHADLTLLGHTHIPFDVIAKEYAVPCATCMAPSKTFNIAGEHFSEVICSNRTLEKELRHRLRSLHLSPDLLATATAEAAYKGGFAWLTGLREHLSEQVSYITRRLEESRSGLHFVVPEASFIGFIDCSERFEAIKADEAANPELYDRSRSPSGGVVSRFFGQRANIAMNDGTWFGSNYGQFVRFNYGTTREAVTNAIESIIAAVENLV
jgi:cystathionine beta-lyase